MVKEKEIGITQVSHLGNSQEFYIGDERFHIKAEKVSGFVPWRRRYIVRSIADKNGRFLPVDDIIINNEQYPFRRTALDAARERIAGQSQLLQYVSRRQNL